MGWVHTYSAFISIEITSMVDNYEQSNQIPIKIKVLVHIDITIMCLMESNLI